MAAPIPTWQERLKACFRWQQRFLQVFGAPSALGAVTAVGAAVALNPDTGLALGALTALTGVVLSGYYVVAGFDRRLIRELMAEETGRVVESEQAEVFQVLMQADPLLRAQLERVLQLHATIDAVFTDGIDDAVEAILQNSRGDLATLRQRAISMLKLHQRLASIVQQSNAEFLMHEARRMDHELAQTPAGPVRDALLAARESTERTLEQWRNAAEKQAQVRSVLTLIENNFQEFRLAMELRKADAAVGSATSGRDVSELQSRLAAAGEACDELVGRASVAPARRAKRRVS